MSSERTPLAIVCRGPDRAGVLYEMSSVIVRHGGYIASVDLLERGDRSAIFWELTGVDDEEAFEDRKGAGKRQRTARVK